MDILFEDFIQMIPKKLYIFVVRTKAEPSHKFKWIFNLT